MNAIVLLAALAAPPIYTGPTHHAVRINTSYKAWSCQPATIQQFPGGSAITYHRPGPLREFLFGPAARVIVTNPVQAIPITCPPTQPQIVQPAPAACPPINLPIQIQPNISPPVTLPISGPPAEFPDIVNLELLISIGQQLREIRDQQDENENRLVDKIRDSELNIIDRIRESELDLKQKIGELVPVPQPGQPSMTPEQVMARLLELNEAQIDALIQISEQLKAAAGGARTSSLTRF